ncbi:hypothetical protein THASP1DRAFT_32054 [Thamnocephalis sphaerospora]|uniref:Phorbol-ester/DAG-type domain-containing protein n=1 Tax=Thamnocephalis sphaerospora TaxID=78915 RepID=A0A4P9XK06_9FUNG|nr:hypothetical protein THASP1DRAFT_32054 [Thamnocephalis sphaerospora]|eukprot:RKP06124.1 hypothetical protein THASP1DRAFT_32054 [Thamnocephalis sphaerospora]
MAAGDDKSTPGFRPGRRLKRASRIRIRLSSTAFRSRKRRSQLEPSGRGELADLVRLMLTRAAPLPPNAPPPELFAFSAQQRPAGSRRGAPAQTAPKGLAEVAQCAVRLRDLLKASDLHVSEGGEERWSQGLPSRQSGAQGGGSPRLPSAMLLPPPSATSPAGPLLAENGQSWQQRRPSLAPRFSFLSADTSVSAELSLHDTQADVLQETVRVLEGLVVGECLYPMSMPAVEKQASTGASGVVTTGDDHRWHLQTVAVEIARELVERDAPGALEAILPAISLFQDMACERLLDLLEGAIQDASEEAQLYAKELVGELGSLAFRDATSTEPAAHTSLNSAAGIQTSSADDVSNLQETPPPPGFPQGMSQGLLSAALMHDYTHSLFHPVLLALLAHAEDMFADTRTGPSTIIQRCQYLLGLMARVWPGMPQALLRVVADGDATAAQNALCLLHRWWPAAVGHQCVTRMLDRTADPVVMHHRYAPKLNSAGDTGMCAVCKLKLDQMAAWCGGCHAAVHIGCIETLHASQQRYQYTTARGVHRQAKPSWCAAETTGSTFAVQAQRTASDGEHDWEACHLFALVLCACCARPLWGTSRQGVRCRHCGRFAHHGCRNSMPSRAQCDVPLDHRSFSADSEALLSNFTQECSHLLHICGDECQLGQNDAFLLQSQLLLQRNMAQAGFEKHCLELDTPKAADQLLATMDASIEQLTLCQQRRLQEGENASLQEQLFDFASLVQMCQNVVTEARRNYMAAGLFSKLDLDCLLVDSDWLTAYIGTLIGATPASSQYIVGAMVGAGLLGRHTVKGARHTGSRTSSEVIYCFPLPFVEEPTLSADALVYAVESCLADINLSLNEVGLLLLVRRCTVNDLSCHHVRMLMRSVIAWTCGEASRLEQLHSTYTTLGHRQAVGLLDEIIDETIGANAYVQARRKLADKYAVGWMRSIYTLDCARFCTLVNECVAEWCDATDEALQVQDEDEDDRAAAVARLGGRLDVILRLRFFGMLFDVFNDVFSIWTDRNIAETNLQRDEFMASSAVLATQVIAAVPIPAVQKAFGAGRYQRMSNPHMLSAGGLPEYLSLHDVDTPLMLAKTEQVILRLVYLQMAGIEISCSTLEWLANILENQPVLSPHAALCCVLLLWKKLLVPAKDSETLEYTVLPRFIVLLHGSQVAHLRTVNEKYATKTAVDQALFNGLLALFLCACGCNAPEIDELGLLPHDVEKNGLPSHHKTKTASSIQLTDRSPIVQPLLDFLHLTMLDSEFKTIHTVDALRRYGRRVALMKTFILSIQPKLLPRVWAAMQSYQANSAAFVLPVFLELINAEKEYFGEFVKQEFGEDLQRRFNAVDCAFGMFAKLTDDIFKSENCLPLLGSVFSCVMECLWDKEVRVAIKVKTLLESLRDDQRERMFRLWGAHFSDSDEAGQSRLCQLMIKTSNTYPGWKVLSWSILLDGLGRTIAPINIDAHATHRKTGSISFGTLDQTEWAPSAEDNLTVHLVVLAFRMLGQHVPISATELCTLKYLIVLQMGFTSCFVRRVRQEVQFDQLEFDPSNMRQRAIVHAGMSGMNRVLDIYQILRDPLSAASRPAEDWVADENLVLGACFVGVLLKALTSNADLTLFDDGMLRCWIESFVVVTCKYYTRDESQTESIILAVKRLAAILTRDISADNKILILSAWTFLLQQAPTIIAATLWRVIYAAGSLLTELRDHPRTVLFSKTRNFLAQTVCKFCESGIFLLICKNSPSPVRGIDVEDLQHEMDMVFVLKAVITDIERHPPDGFDTSINLREQPVYDVLTRAFSLRSLDKPGLSGVFFNLHRYLSITYPLPLSSSLVVEFADFLGRLSRHTAHWDEADLDTRPVLAIMAIMLREHPGHYSTLISASIAFFRHTLQRFEVTREAALKVIQSGNEITFEAAASPEQRNEQRSPLARALVAELVARLDGRNAMSPSTAANCLELICVDVRQGAGKTLDGRYKRVFPESLISSASRECINYMQRPMLSRPGEERVCMAAVHFLAACIECRSLHISDLLVEKEDASGALRLLIWLCVAALTLDASALYRALFGADHISPVIVHAFSGRAARDTQEMHQLGFLCLKAVSLAYHAIIASEGSTADDGVRAAASEERLWQKVWPVLMEQLALTFNPIIQRSANFGALWKGFIDMVVFLQRTRSRALGMFGDKWAMLLDRYMDRVGAVDAKVSEARRGLDTLPPEKGRDLQLETLVAELLRMAPKGEVQSHPIGMSWNIASSLSMGGAPSTPSTPASTYTSIMAGMEQATHNTVAGTTSRSRKQDLSDMFRSRTVRANTAPLQRLP